MRIGYIADSNCNHGHKWISYLATQHEVILICEEGREHSSLYNDNPGVKVFPILPRTYPLRNFLERKKKLREIGTLLKKQKTDFIHALYAVPYAFWAKDSGLPYMVTTRGSDVLLDYRVTFRQSGSLTVILRNYLLRRIFRQSLEQARFITSTSTPQQEVIRTLLKSDEKLKLIRTGVETETFAENNNHKPNTDELIIFSNRAMAPLYNIHLIIDAFRILLKKMPGKKLRLISINYYGDESYARTIKEKIKNSGLESLVKISDPQKGSALADLYRNSNLVIMIPASDGTPVSGIECLLSGTPLLTGPVTYDNDLFNENTCWKVDSFDPEKIAARMFQILNEDPSILEQKTIEGRRQALAHADFKTEIKKVEALYTRMIP